MDRARLPSRIARILLVLATGWLAGGASAAPIAQIDIPITGTTYDVLTGELLISGRPTSDVSVLYNDGRVPNPETYGYTIFTLSTEGLDSTLSNGGSAIDYVSSGGVGSILLVDGNQGFSPLFEADLISLSLAITPGSGGLLGYGEYLVTGGSLAPDFGAVGDLTTLAISFQVPLDFNSSFAALANTQLLPGAAMPEPTAFVSFGLGVGLVAWRLSRRRPGRAPRSG